MSKSLEASATDAHRSEYSVRWRSEGFQEAFAEGFEEGRLRSARRILIMILELTPGGISTQHRRRIEASTDRRELDDWLDVIFRIRNWSAPVRE
jgi:hypothetical protein